VSGLLDSIPLYAVMVEDLGERGAQFVAVKLLQNEPAPSHQPGENSASSLVTVAISVAAGAVLGLFIAGKKWF
jgi:hypothetical protein